MITLGRKRNLHFDDNEQDIHVISGNYEERHSYDYYLDLDLLSISY
jgi:hypothetical protein